MSRRLVDSPFDRNLPQLYHPRAMGQRRILAAAAILTAVALAAAVAIHWKPRAPSILTGKEPRVASVTPVGTDLVVAMGAGDHLVAVSNYDVDRDEIKGRPKVGDYQSIDWEKLAPLQPQILITQYGASRFPPGLEGRCRDIGISIVNIKLDQLQDIERETIAISRALKEPEKGEAAVAKFKKQLDAVKTRVAGMPPVKALVVTSDSGLSLAGPGEFHDEILTLAGGANAAAKLNNPYPTVDREALLAMAPQVVIQLIPEGDKTPQVMAQAHQFWDSLPDLPAVKNKSVYILTDWYVLQPGLRVADLAEKFADILHPEKTP
jgi:iron complex transport system substrate-binding protein